MAYKGTNEEGEEFTGGEPSPQEKSMSDEENGAEYDPEKHNITEFL
jgi:hypothetical protein